MNDKNEKKGQVKRGRPTKYKRKMTDSEKQAEYRERMKKKGYRLITTYVPAGMTQADVKEACLAWKENN